MMKKLFLFIFIAIFGISLTSKAQVNPTNILRHDIPYSTHHQDMWGGGEAFSLEMDYDLFDIQQNESIHRDWITSILGTQWGIGIDLGIWLFLRSTFSIHGFTLGSVDVDYPVRITLDFPDHHSFDHGQTITINSNYIVRDGWALDTHFPTAGVIALDLEYGFGFNFDIIVCAGTCETIHILPPISIPINPTYTTPLPHDSIAIFYLNSITGEVAYPCLDPITGLPRICNDDILPIRIPDWFNIGLTGEIDIPYVNTTDRLDPATRCLHASGEDEWMWFNLNIMEFLMFIARMIPPPTGTTMQQAINFLNGGTIQREIIDGVTAQIEYFILRLNLRMNSVLVQEFSFCPTIFATLRFPIPLEYTETNPSTGNNIVAQGNSNTITFAVNNNLNVVYPCYDWDSMQVYDVSYHITSGFRNHTWDELRFVLRVEAIFFRITIPTGGLFPVTDIPAFSIPNINMYNPDLGSSYIVSAQSPAIELPALELGNFLPDEAKEGYNNSTKDISFCFPTNCEPLINLSLPLGTIPIPGFDRTWELEGFVQDTVFPGTWLYPKPELDIDVNARNVLCFGDTSGVVLVTAINSTAPFTFDYSWGSQHVSNQRVDSLIVPSGYYYVTLTDTYGCTVDGEINIADAFPPILSNLYPTDVLCHGESTGSITTHVSGGAPPYRFLWQPSLSREQNPTGLASGWHYVTITDSVNCEHYDSVYIAQPLEPLTITYETGAVSCHGYSDGFINLTVTGGTSPYFYIWSNGQVTQDLINIPAGSYSVIITDGHNCRKELTFVITQPEPLVLQTFTQDVLCYGQNTGSIDLIVTGGTPFYSYRWNNGDTIQDPTNLFHGIYIVTVTDSHNCSAFAMAQINQPDLPLTGNIVGTNVRCFGEGNGSADLTVFGGTPPYYYSWSNGEISEDIFNLVPNTYYVTINDAHNCLAYDSVVIIQADAPMAGMISGTNVTCNGGSDGNVYITISGGLPPYQFEWSNGSWQEDLIGIPAGVYTVTATDRNHCHYSLTYTITEPDPFYIQAMDDPTICYGMNTQIGIGIVTGNVPPYTIVWSNFDTGMTTTVAPTETTTYTAQVHDAANCISQDVSITVNVHKPLTMTVVPDKSKVCPNTEVKFDVVINGGGISGEEVYVNDSLVHLPYTALILKDTVFNFVAWDSCHFKNVNVSIPITTYPLPPINADAFPTHGCAPLTVNFYEYSANVGQRYIWNFDDGDFENLSFDKNPTHTFHNARTYHVKLETVSAEQCKIDTAIAITVFPVPKADFRADRTSINLSNPIVHFTNFTYGGFWFNWSFGDGNFSTASNAEHTYSLPGNYRVYLSTTSLYGCKDSATVDIHVANDLTIYAPTAFTPNHDDLNETFRLVANGFDPTTYKLAIYNRWGEIVFQSTKVEEEWNGKTKDKECPQGVYTWKVSFVDLYGNEYYRHGTVTLIK